jgi:hypothetical protein
MAEGAIFLNSGPLFNGERLETLEDCPEWETLHDSAVTAFERVKETFEKHATLLAGNPTVEETRFYMINSSLHALNFTHSVQEVVSLGQEQATRIDYVCFADATDFYEAEPMRESMGFFARALTIASAVAWGQSLDGASDESEGEESGATLQPAQELDLLLRTTGLRYGILTNGCDWRLYHSSTSALVNTFFQADMIAAMKSDFEDFKRFYLLFNRAAFKPGDDGQCFIDRLLQ